MEDPRRALALAWLESSSTKRDLEDPRPMDMPMLETYPMAKATFAKGIKRKNREKPLPSKGVPQSPPISSMAKHSKHSYSNFNSDSDFNSDFNFDFDFNSKPCTKSKPNNHSKPNSFSDTYSLDSCVPKKKEVCLKKNSVDPVLRRLMAEVETSLKAPFTNRGKEEFEGFYDALGEELIKYALEKAVKKGRAYWPFMRGILQILGERGIQSREEAEAYDRAIRLGGTTPNAYLAAELKSKKEEQSE